MHKYMRAIGFSSQNRKEMRELVLDSIRNADNRNYTLAEDDTMFAEFRRNYAGRMGIAAHGTFDDNDKFHMDYYFPYLEGTDITSYEDVSVERHAAQDSFAGVCDDVNVGISLIFYLQNKIPYIKAQYMGKLPVRGTTLTLSALSVQGTVLLPLWMLPSDSDKYRRDSARRSKLIAEARGGNEDAIEMLTLDDMDMYTNISKRVLKEDIYTMVNSCFMPYGVECDHYSILGEIKKVELVTNHITEEQIYILSIFCNELTFDVAINIMDLLGEPEVGRRFKGVIWLQGRINFPDESL